MSIVFFVLLFCHAFNQTSLCVNHCVASKRVKTTFLSFYKKFNWKEIIDKIVEKIKLLKKVRYYQDSECHNLGIIFYVTGLNISWVCYGEMLEL